MQLNYIILAHKNPFQIKRLISRLNSPENSFYIHVDAKEDINSFKHILFQFNNIYFLENQSRREIIWGDLSMVEATVKIMEECICKTNSGYCVLLSGQDYPLQKNENIHSFFKNNYGKIFISIFSLPINHWHNGGLPRLDKYKINKSAQRKHFLLLPSIFEREFYKMKTLGKLNFLRKTKNWNGIFQVFIKRKFPKYLRPYGGGQWWALPIETVNKILEFIRSHPDYVKYHKYTLIPDEIFFHSIIMYLEKESQINISPSITYVNWERTSGPLPVTFTKNDFEELKEASKNYLFARKFDAKNDQEIMDKIDNELLD